MERCKICGNGVGTIVESAADDVWAINCRRCGSYRLDDDAIPDVAGLKSRGWLYVLVGYARQASDAGQSLLLTPQFVRDLAGRNHPGALVSDRLDRVLLWLARKSSWYGYGVVNDPAYDFPIAFSKSAQEFPHLLIALEDLGLVKKTPDGMVVTAQGWERAERLKGQNRSKPEQCFVAMSFDPSLRAAYEDGLAAGIQRAGYKPFRVSDAEHNGKIDDLIVSEIRRSGLLVADFTLHRAGVYFEAGLAMGQGIPVIWTCREDDIKNAHFDTRQYNHITWTMPAELAQKLELRIMATAPLRAGS